MHSISSTYNTAVLIRGWYLTKKINALALKIVSPKYNDDYHLKTILSGKWFHAQVVADSNTVI